MNLVDLQLQFAESPSLRLLRAENAPLVLTTLFAAFKREHHAVVAESRLRALLEAEIGECPPPSCWQASLTTPPANP